MANCEYFKQTKVSSPTFHPIGGAPMQLSTVVNWCSHRNSPAPERIATDTIGGEKLLTCGADLGRCQIAVHNR